MMKVAASTVYSLLVVVLALHSQASPEESALKRKAEIQILEKLWEGNDPLQYLERASKLCQEVRKTNNPATKQEEGASILESFLSKEIAPAPAINGLDIGILRNGVDCLLNTEGYYISLPRYALLLSRARGRVEQESIPSYKPLMEYGNVPLPAGRPLESVTDPAVRSFYEKLVRENEQNKTRNRRQELLKDFKTEFYSRIQKRLSDLFSANKELTGELEECLRAGKFSKEEKAQIRAQIRR